MGQGGGDVMLCCTFECPAVSGCENLDSALEGVSGVMQENWTGQLEIGKGWDS